MKYSWISRPSDRSAVIRVKKTRDSSHLKGVSQQGEQLMTYFRDMFCFAAQSPFVSVSQCDKFNRLGYIKAGVLRRENLSGERSMLALDISSGNLLI